MAERLISIRIFEGALISGLASGVESSAIRIDRDVIRVESLTFLVSSVASTPDVGFQYAPSRDNVLFGSYADNAALLASTLSLANPEGFQTLAMPNPLAPYFRIMCSGVTSNPTDTRCTADIWLRMS